MPKVDAFLTVAEAAEFLRVAPNTIRNWTSSGRIPYFRHPISNYRLFRKEDLEEVLRRILDSGRLPSGWRRSSNRNRKPR